MQTATSYPQSALASQQALSVHPPNTHDDEDEQVESDEDEDVRDDHDEYRGSSGGDHIQVDHQNAALAQSTSAASFHGQVVQQPLMPSNYGYPVVPMPYPMVAPNFMPYFLTPPYHNPYSPTGGTGHLHPPHISQNSYSTSSVPPLPPPSAMPTELQGVGGSTQLPTTSYDQADAAHVESSGSDDPPPNKRLRRTNAVDDDELQNRSIDELYIELPPPPPVEDPDPSAPPNSHPGRVPYQKFQCKMCDAKFPRRNAAVAHIKTHLGKRRFTCSHEGCLEQGQPGFHKFGCTEVTFIDSFSTAAFVREHDCKRHELTHTATRNFTCLWPDALRRHKEKGHCGLTAAKNVEALAQDLDPTWTEGRPDPVGTSEASSSAKQPGLAYTAEDHASLLDLTRQLQAVGGVPQPIPAPTTFPTAGPSDPGGQDDVDGEAVEEPHSADRNPNDTRAPSTSSANKSTKKLSSRSKRPLPETGRHIRSDAHAVMPAPEKSVTISTTAVESRAESSIYDTVFGPSSYPTEPGVPPGASAFLPFLQIAPQNTSTTPQQGHSLTSTSFPPSSGSPYPADFITGPTSFTYSTENSYPVPASSASGVLPASFPLSSSSADTASGSISQPSFSTIAPNVAGPTGAGNFPRSALPVSGSDPASRNFQTEVNSTGPASTAKTGMSLVEIAVDAATRAQQLQQRQQEREAFARAQSEHHQPHPNHFGSIGGVQTGGSNQIDGIELDMSKFSFETLATEGHGANMCSLLHKGDVVDDLDGTDVIETPTEQGANQSSTSKTAARKKVKPHTPKTVNVPARSGLRTRSRATATS
ncbi:hypothetical protein FRC00_001753 [Tulasnella sp. 408]|nr:hypothetical protein FRC00_001753 [Tulasnella sp. 408]